MDQGSRHSRTSGMGLIWKSGWYVTGSRALVHARAPRMDPSMGCRAQLEGGAGCDVRGGEVERCGQM
jgi:hypothetical protein